ncbi:nucleotide-binding protein [Pseudomonas sp. WS 5106]|uniref:Nucleotide-binding protein n=1 Tax=Pseudomonas cremoris TaxID=2724178 RepID=A0A7X1AQN8_9PSED|nr:nucleotide-binding protein [Pseudomonas cremoris]MBC2382236.1 nucleotide-binding protein [Pseudomonas cremoris]MBC2408612.1 nucleotide-binding protein [Pseudomonas cremoris]
MARVQPPTEPSVSKLQSQQQNINRSIDRLRERVSELEAFDLSSVRNGLTPEVRGLEVRIKDTLVRCFGENTSTYNDLQSAASLAFFPRFRTNGVPTDYVGRLEKNIKRAIELLRQGQKTLAEDLADYEHEHETKPEVGEVMEGLSRRVFVVHGHDDGSREMVARFLEKVGFEAVILHEQANQGRTVIEKVEAHGDVGFAVVLLTPDDEGCVKGGTPEPRARQNVILELGYFIGRLGRGKVCALKKGALEIPSDYAGVVYESLDGNWKHALGRELQEAGHEIDWNKVMRS